MEPATAPDLRPLRRSVVVGVFVGLSAGAISFAVVAIPFFTLASFEPNGLSRPIVRTGLFAIALPVGSLLGLISGTIAGWWYRQGRSWTVDDGGDRYSNH